MTTVGLPGASLVCRPQSPTLAEVLKPLGLRTGQFGKNHLGDRNEHLPTVHGFDEFFGNLYHLNTQEEFEQVDYRAKAIRSSRSRNTARAVFSIARPPTWTIRRSIPASARSANRRSRTPDSSARSG